MVRMSIARAATCIAAPIVKVQNSSRSSIADQRQVFMFERGEFENSDFQVICFLPAFENILQPVLNNFSFRLFHFLHKHIGGGHLRYYYLLDFSTLQVPNLGLKIPTSSFLFLIAALTYNAMAYFGKTFPIILSVLI